MVELTLWVNLDDIGLEMVSGTEFNKFELRR